MNRLAQATSPYLLQHAHNPVDWYEWGPEAIELARREDKPIFLSIGYAACHWCHVMEREVFENPAIAAVMNEHFVNIKVDREERPDLDELYMMATQLMTGSGGWPMSVWLTPDLQPFYAGTYFPPEDGYGRPGFPRLERALAESWQTKRAALEKRAQEIAEVVRKFVNDEAAEDPKGHDSVEPPVWLHAAMDQWADRFDEAHGGIGGAPKFPPSQALNLWAEMVATGAAEAQDTATARRMLVGTLDAMMRGGIYDQIGGGFARYSTDAHWHIPHFEKMLYDNAQLAEVYARAAVALDRTDYARITREVCDFWLREMTASEGGFHSTLDADSEGVEGKYYVWTLAEMQTVLGADDAALLAEHFGATVAGNWDEGPRGGTGAHGVNVLFIARTVEELAAARGTDAAALRARIDAARERLRRARDQRVRPNLDDKILTGWNGLMISALAIAGRSLNEPRYIAAAAQAAQFLLHHHAAPGGMLRSSRGNAPAHIPAFLEDYAYLLHGLLDLHESARDPATAATTRTAAIQLADTLLAHFEDPAHGGFFFTSADHEHLFARLKNALDNATPSANGVAIRALFQLGRLTNDEKYVSAAVRAVKTFAPMISRQPSGFATILRALHNGSPAIPAAPSAATMPAAPEPIRVELLHIGAPNSPASTVHRGGTLELEVALTIAPGFHVQSSLARLRADFDTSHQTWSYPAPEQLSPGLTGYRNRILLRGRTTIPAATPTGPHALRLIVEAQPCRDDACLLRLQLVTPITIEVL